jgi:hypothetical protein
MDIRYEEGWRRTVPLTGILRMPDLMVEPDPRRVIEPVTEPVIEPVIGREIDLVP